MKTLPHLRSGWHFRGRNDAGFTRRDLLAPMLVLTLLAAILVPVARRSLQDAQAQGMMNQGAAMYKAISSMEPLNPEAFPGTLFPDSSNRFASSTQYFIHLVTNRTLNLHFFFFSGPGLARYHTGDPAAFRQDGNAWSVVEDTADAPAAAALFMSRNLLSEHRYLPTGRTVIPEQDMREQGTGKKLTINGRSAVVVTRAGAAWISIKKELPAHSLNPDDAERRILHP